MIKKPYCFGNFPKDCPPLAEDCYNNCSYSIVLCKQETHKNLEEKK